MKILLSLASWNPSQGGPFFFVRSLSRSLSFLGHEIHLVAVNYPNMPAHVSPEGVSLHLVEGKIIPGIRQIFLYKGRKQIDNLIKQIRPDVIHDNGLWLTFNHEIALSAKYNKIPRVISPMGMLNPWALRYNNWKKQIALRLFQKKDLRHSNAFHAASDLEADSIRAFGLKQPISIIPHDVHITPDQAHFCSENYRIALFLGRLHPVKNLMSLIHAWAMVKPKGWKLRLVGPDEVNHRKALERLTAKLGASDCIEISGPVYGSEKVALLADAQLSFLVSKSENFGISAAESLAAGVPVIASRSVPWSCLKEERMGWWVEGEVEALAAAIAEATSLSESELQAMGIIGRAYAKKHFCWEAISIRFAEFYDQLVKSCKK